MKHKCVCCGHKTFQSENALEHEICPVCFWENDPVQNSQPDYSGGANRVSLLEARENYKKYGAVSQEYSKNVRPPLDDEL